MNLHRPLRSSARIWLACSLLLFAGCWFVRFPPVIEEPMAVLFWRKLISGDHSLTAMTDWFTVLGLVSLFFAIPAAFAGWILHYFVCMAADWFRKNGRTVI